MRRRLKTELTKNMRQKDREKKRNGNRKKRERNKGMARKTCVFAVTTQPIIDDIAETIKFMNQTVVKMEKTMS